MHGTAEREQFKRVPTTIYDDVRYSNYPHAPTHPDRLATVATLHGLEPPDPSLFDIPGSAGRVVSWRA